MQQQRPIKQDKPMWPDKGLTEIEILRLQCRPILAGNNHKSDCDSDSENDHVDIDLPLTTMSDDEWQKPFQQVYMATISEISTKADFTIEMKDIE